jgi:formate dehydrogenase accessory protein FdhE
MMDELPADLEPWLRPLSVALATLATEPWRSLQPAITGPRPTDAPLLHDATITIDAAAATELVRAVLAEVFGFAPAITRDVARALIEAAVACDDAQIQLLAERLDVDGAALAAASQLAVMPLLHRCRAAVQSETTRSWPHGDCPICGALPAFVEVRGLERSRKLRCSRCGSDWASAVLLCVFCGERNHQQLGSLSPDGPHGQIHWVETCATCRGYLKAMTTLRGALPEAVAREDARSIELDLVAAERGYERPAQPPRPVHVRVLLSERV